MSACPEISIAMDFAPLEIATSNSTIKEIAKKLLSSIGYDSWIFACDNPASIFGMSHLVGGIPFQWVTTYLAKGYKDIDPIFKHCRESDEPLYWDATYGWDDAENKVKTFMRDLHACGFGSGFAIPLHSSNGKLGILSIVNAQPLKQKEQSYLQNTASARAIGIALHSAMERIASKQPFPEAGSLSM